MDSETFLPVENGRMWVGRSLSQLSVRSKRSTQTSYGIWSLYAALIIWPSNTEIESNGHRCVIMLEVSDAVSRLICRGQHSNKLNVMSSLRKFQNPARYKSFAVSHDFGPGREAKEYAPRRCRRGSWISARNPKVSFGQHSSRQDLEELSIRLDTALLGYLPSNISYDLRRHATVNAIPLSSRLLVCSSSISSRTQ